MIKLEAVKEFSLQRFDELKNIKRKGKEEKGKIFLGDTFECEEDLANYLTGNNEKKYVVAKVIEVLPEENILDKIEEVPVEEKPVLEIGKPRKAKLKKNK